MKFLNLGNLKNQFQKMHSHPKLFWWALLIVLGLLSFYWDRSQPMVSSLNPPSSAVANTDTYIPNGFVLVPIEVANYESLDSILGQFGVVDLFVPPTKPGSKSRRVARRIKILRAPLNPSHFAVLAPESEAAELVHYQGAFFVIVQNPNRSGTAFESAALPIAKLRSRLQIELPEN